MEFEETPVQFPETTTYENMTPDMREMLFNGANLIIALENLTDTLSSVDNKLQRLLERESSKKFFRKS